VIFCDDLDRAQETARILADELGITEIITDRRLRPLNVGDFTGKPKDEHPLDIYIENRDKKIPGGDSLNQFDKRAASVFADILDTVIKHKVMVLVVGHGSTVSYLHNHIETSEEPVSYEGLTYPGGVCAVYKDGVIPLLKRREDHITDLVQLNKWSIGFVGGGSTNHEPKSCFNCHLMYGVQNRCAILGPDIVIDRLQADGKTYTPVCGMHDAGKPMMVPDAAVEYRAAELGVRKADEVGLEWSVGRGTNCGGANDGASCKYFIAATANDKPVIDGICAVLKEGDNLVDGADCCSAHDGPSMDWRNAQEILKG
jgi:broad specificity phosphatase PhoE